MDQMLKELREQNPELATVFAGIQREHSRTIFARTIAVISVVGLVIVGWFSAEQYTQSKHAAESAKEAATIVRNSAIENCQASTKPGGVRYIIASQIQTQIDQSKTLNYDQFFPNVPPKKLHELLDQQRKLQESQKKQLLDVNCQALYPPAH